MSFNAGPEGIQNIDTGIDSLNPGDDALKILEASDLPGFENMNLTLNNSLEKVLSSTDINGELAKNNTENNEVSDLVKSIEGKGVNEIKSLILKLMAEYEDIKSIGNKADHREGMEGNSGIDTKLMIEITALKKIFFEKGGNESDLVLKYNRYSGKAPERVVTPIDEDRMQNAKSNMDKAFKNS